jgi:hypothetical protein
MAGAEIFQIPERPADARGPGRRTPIDAMIVRLRSAVAWRPSRAHDLGGIGMSFPTAPVAAGSLIGGYLVARETGVRPLGGVVLAAGGVVMTRQWARKSGPVKAGALLGIYLGGFGASHPLAKKIGAWPAVLTVSALSAAASWTLSDSQTPAATES